MVENVGHEDFWGSHTVRRKRRREQWSVELHVSGFRSWNWIKWFA